MKILLINKFHYLRGGSERVYFDTLEILRQHGHEVRCFSMKDSQNVDDSDGRYFVDNVDFSENKSFLRKTKNIFWNVQAQKKLQELLDDFRPQVAHIHNFTRQLSPSILSILQERKIKIVQTLHDYSLICPNGRLFTAGEVCEKCQVHNYWQAVENKCVKDSYAKSLLAMLEMIAYWWLPIYRQKIDAFISPSRFLAQKLTDWKVKKEVFVVPNPVVSLKKGISNLGSNIVFAGRLAEEKGIDLLLSAIRHLPNYNFVICGDGPKRNEVLRAQKKFTNLRYLGQLSSAGLRKTIAEARLMVVPSIWYENYPMAILEAQVMGKTVLASSLGGSEEMITDNVTGLLFSANSLPDLLEKISVNYNDLQKLQKIGSLAQSQVLTNNTAEIYYEKLLEVYEKVIESVVDLG
ncbi:MAG: glycosyltransferase [Patescibacteria group bacterium]